MRWLSSILNVVHVSGLRRGPLNESTFTNPPPCSMQSISGREIRGWSGTLYTVFHHANASTNPAHPINQKQLCQPYLSVNHPNSPPNANREKYCEALKIDEARPRSAVGNHAATMRPLPGNTGDCASPESSRNPKIMLKAPAAGT